MDSMDPKPIQPPTTKSTLDEPLTSLKSAFDDSVAALDSARVGASTALKSTLDESFTALKSFLAGSLAALDSKHGDSEASKSDLDKPLTALKSALDNFLAALSSTQDEASTKVNPALAEAVPIPKLAADNSTISTPKEPTSLGTSFQPRHVHIVGSVCLKSNTEVFERLTTTFPTQLKRIPDGETGDRFYFVLWQRDSFKPWLVQWFGERQEEKPSEPWTIEPINTRYDEAALESYKEFCRLRDEGIIAKGIRFQVSIPTPINILAFAILPKYHSAVEPLLEAALMAAARRIQDSIPKEDLAIQWDMAFDIALIEFSKFDTQPDWKPAFIPAPWFSPVKEGILERAVRIMKCVDEDVPMGVHLCYGDAEHKHFIQPEDTKVMVELANDMSADLGRDFDWIHMPVPKGRVDDAYFEPLKDLKLKSDADLVLGLAHAGDLEGTKKRIEVAGKFAKSFAVGTECGMGRMQEDEFDDVLKVMAAVTTV